jgi:iron(III) transport system substrate-binding protein
MVSVAMLQKVLGWEFFEKARANGAKMGQGSGQVVDDTASGDLKACIGVDYIVLDKIKKGATLGFVYPKEMLVVPSPVAIFKGTPNLKAAKIFVDFLLSKQGQTIIANNYTLPIRLDVSVAKKDGMIEIKEAVKRAIPINYLKMIDEKQTIIEKFTAIMMKK